MTIKYFISILILFLTINNSFALAKKNEIKHHKKNHKIQRKATVEFKSLKSGKKLKRIKGELLVKYKSPKNKRKTKKRFLNQKHINSHTSLIVFDEERIDFLALKNDLTNDLDVEIVEPNLIIKSLDKHDKKHELSKKQRRKSQRAYKAFNKSIKLSKKNKRTKSVKVGIIDTGIDFDHPDLIGKVVGGINLIHNPENYGINAYEANDTTYMDYNGHGTKVAGIVGANQNDIGIDGLSKDVDLYAIKAFDQSGEAYLSDVISGLDWAVNQKIDIVNMSFGVYEYSQLFEECIKNARINGVVLVSSAGNDYTGESMYPAKFSGVLNVGSHDEDHWVSRFSNWGRSVDFFTVGNNLISTNSSKISSSENPYSNFNGTSASAAFVTGLLALSLELGVDANDLKTHLQGHLIKRYNERNPVGFYKELNVEGYLNSLSGEKFSQLTFVKLTRAKRVYSYDDRVEIEYIIQNTGTKSTKKQKVKFVSEVREIDKDVGFVLIPSLRPGETSKGKIGFSPSTVFGESVVRKKGMNKINVSFDNENNLFKDIDNVEVFITDLEFSAIAVNSLWLDVNKNKINISFKNIGNKPIENVELELFVSPHVHEVGLDKKIVISKKVKLGLIKPNKLYTQSVSVDNPMDIVKGDMSIIAVITKNEKIVKRHIENYKVKNNKFKIQYAEIAHRASVDEAFKLLVKNKIHVADFEVPKYIGNRNSYNDWPHVDWVGFESNRTFYNNIYFDGDELVLQRDDEVMSDVNYSFTNSTDSYFTDDVLNSITGLHEVNGFSAIDGAHDCDAVDIAFNLDGLDLWDSHFWIVDNGDDDGLDDSHSALTKIKVLLHGKYDGAPSDTKLVHGAIDHYKEGHKQAAWWLLGHALHLMGDISLPSHVNDENSHGLYGAPYHGWMNENHTLWSADGIDEGIIDPYQEAAQGDPIKFLAYTTAQIGNSWPHAHTNDMTDIGKEGNRVLGVNSAYSTYMSSIFSQLPNHPLSIQDINKNEVIDWFGDCDSVDIIGPTEESEDCWNGGDDHLDFDNTDDQAGTDIGGSDLDGDLSTIGNHSYTYAIRSIAGLIYYFLVETGQLKKGVINSYNIVPTIITPLLLN